LGHILGDFPTNSSGHPGHSFGFRADLFWQRRGRVLFPFWLFKGKKSFEKNYFLQITFLQEIAEALIDISPNNTWEN
jgi:hypothetical protein